MSEITHRQSRTVLIGFGAILVFAWACYAPAISGAFQLDDYVNLGGLAKVTDARSALDYILSGIAGPTGRPLALASFALQAEQWTQGASAFLRVNILIHLLNGALVAACLYQLSLRQAVARYEAALVAIAAASLWVLMPLLATASLLVVQRMTTLSAMFMLLGLNGYLYARSRTASRPRQALIGMSAWLAVGTVLATFCKESGVLLPALVLVLETTVLKRPDHVSIRDWQIFRWAFLVSPLILVAVYLGSWLDYPDHVVASRGFNAWERLFSESRILWVYLAKAVVGVPGSLGIYQESQVVSRSLASPLTLLAFMAWSGALLAATVWRRRYPLFSIAVLWFLIGHAIESTVVPLELYFEHRNYIPIIGPLYALCAFLILSPGRVRIAGVLIPTIALLSSWFLYSFATLSGDPPFAARYWAAKHPASHRAIMTYARFQQEEEGPIAVIETIEATVSSYPELGYMRIPQLQMLCKIAPKNDYRQIVSQLERELPTVNFRYAAATMLSDLYDTASRTDCIGVDPATVVSLAGTLRTNARYANDPIYNQFYYNTLADYERVRGNYDESIEYLHQAISYQPSPYLNEIMVTVMGEAEKFDAAHKFIDEAARREPKNPIKALQWRSGLDKLRERVRHLEQEAATKPRDGRNGESARS